MRLRVTKVEYLSDLVTRQAEPWRASFNPDRPNILVDAFCCRLTFKDGRTLDVDVPAGTGTDFASYQWWMLPGFVLPEKAEVAHPSTLHDYLMWSRALEKRLSIGPWKADRLADQAYRVGQGWITPAGRWAGYLGVRLGSWLRALDRWWGTSMVWAAPACKSGR